MSPPAAPDTNTIDGPVVPPPLPPAGAADRGSRPPSRGWARPPAAVVRLPSIREAAVPADGATPAASRSYWPRVSLGLYRDSIAVLSSTFVHCVALIVLALVILGGEPKQPGLTLITQQGEDESPAELLPDPVAVLSPDPAAEAPSFAELPQVAMAPEAPNIASPFAAASVAAARQPTEQVLDLSSSQLLQTVDVPVGGGFEGRTQAHRARLALGQGGTPASENAVELALQWLARHQRQDGGWWIDHTTPDCDGTCDHAGSNSSTTGATGLALLPFLGAGYTHQDGPYQEVVGRGLYYLQRRMIETRRGGDLQEGTMYGHGIAALALGEAYAMTRDAELRPFAQQAVDFICSAQHPRGGWRYLPGDPGDTTVTGWQVMALKSGRLAGLHVPSTVTENAKRFLDSVQEGNGAFYGYLRPDKKPCTTAVGLLLRMYLGWRKSNPHLADGVRYLASVGPSPTDVYYDYYATQVLHHYQGTVWREWNERMREHLVTSQVRQGHGAGSWFFPDPHGTIGGRLYTTAVSAMILEVYYRHLPLYGDQAVEDQF